MRTQLDAVNLAALKMLEEYYQPCDHPMLVFGEMACSPCLRGVLAPLRV